MLYHTDFRSFCWAFPLENFRRGAFYESSVLWDLYPPSPTEALGRGKSTPSFLQNPEYLAQHVQRISAKSPELCCFFRASAVGVVVKSVWQEVSCGG